MFYVTTTDNKGCFDCVTETNRMKIQNGFTSQNQNIIQLRALHHAFNTIGITKQDTNTYSKVYIGVPDLTEVRVLNWCKKVEITCNDSSFKQLGIPDENTFFNINQNMPDNVFIVGKYE